MEECITLIGKVGRKGRSVTANVIKEWKAEFSAIFNYPKKKQPHVTWNNIERKKIAI